MNKKILIGVITIVVVIVIIVGAILFLRKNKENKENKGSSTNNTPIEKVEQVEKVNKGDELSQNVEKGQFDNLGAELRKEECLKDISLDKLKKELNVDNSNTFRDYANCKAIENRNVSDCDIVKSTGNENYMSCVANVINFVYFKEIVVNGKCANDFCSNDILLNGVRMSRSECDSLCSIVAGGDISGCANLAGEFLKKECNLVLGKNDAYCGGVAADKKQACLGDSYLVGLFKNKDAALLEKIKQLPDWSSVYVQADRYMSGGNCDGYFKELLKKDYCNR